jgi:hypothetical protein
MRQSHSLTNRVWGLVRFLLSLMVSLLALGLLVFALATLSWPFARYALGEKLTFAQVAAGILVLLIAQSPLFVLVVTRLPRTSGRLP